MAVYLGNSGLVSIQRTGANAYTSVLDTADVNVALKRFSLDFPNDTFITGDYVEIVRVGGGDLDFIDPTGFTPPGLASVGNWYVNVDPIGGLRLYQTWGQALAGDTTDAITLYTPSTNYTISLSIAGTGYKTLGEVVSYELSTQRVALDATVLGDAFVNQVSGLISGSGRFTCFWDFTGTDDTENAQYLHHLILRQQLGSNFDAALVLKRSGESAATGVASTDGLQLYYLITGLITDVGISFESSSTIQSQIEFVTTGSIGIRYSTGGSLVGNLLLQESLGAMDLESGLGRVLQDDV
jgi:hypothetical protein